MRNIKGVYSVLYSVFKFGCHTSSNAYNDRISSVQYLCFLENLNILTWKLAWILCNIVYVIMLYTEDKYTQTLLKLYMCMIIIFYQDFH